MQTLNKLLINICATNLSASKDFYVTLFDFAVDYDSDWFIHLISEDKKLELGIIERSHELVPVEFQGRPGGFYITLVVEDADAVFEVAKNNNFEVVERPTDTFYGQRRLLLKDPNDVLVDVSSPIPNFKF